MSREIIFRGKRADNGEWVYGDFVNSHEGCHIIESDYFKPSNGGHPELTDVDPSTVGQFTGLTDSKGNKVFEGDVLIYIATNMSDMEVKFENGCFVGEGPFNTHPLSTYLSSGDFESIEVSGNIHDKQS